MYQANQQKGQGLIEVVVAMTILAVIMALVAIAAFTSVRRAHEAAQRSKATYLAQEGMEIIKNFKDRNWGLTEDAPACVLRAAAGDPCIFTQKIIGDPDSFVDAEESFKTQITGPYCINRTLTLKYYLSATGCTDSEGFTRTVTISDSIIPPTSLHTQPFQNEQVKRVQVKVDYSGGDVILVGYYYKWKDPKFGG